MFSEFISKSNTLKFNVHVQIYFIVMQIDLPQYLYFKT